MNRTLVAKGINKKWDIERHEDTVSISQNGNKPRSKKFKTPTDAIIFSQKESWKLLKKGFIYQNPKPEKYEPALHLYIGAGHTGYMPIAPVADSNSFYVAHVLGQFEQENIFKIDNIGTIKLVAEMPPPSLTFDMSYSSIDQILLINANHNILQVHSTNGELSRLSSEKEQLVSAFSVAGNRIAWVDGIMLRVTDRSVDQVIWQTKLSIESHKLYSHEVCAGLSIDGKTLAYYTTEDTKKIYLVNLDTKKETVIEKDSEAITKKIYFSANGEILYIQETKDSWQIKYYHINKKDSWYRLSDSGEDTVMESAVDQSHNRLAVSICGLVKVYDMHTQEELFRFTPENMLKYCNVAFLKDYIAAYTDHGCVSLYKI